MIDTNNNGSHMVSTREASQATGMAASSIARAVRAGGVAGANVGSRVVVDLDSLKNYISADHRRRPRAPRSKAKLAIKKQVRRKAMPSEDKIATMRARQHAPQQATSKGLLARMTEAEARLDEITQQIVELSGLLR